MTKTVWIVWSEEIAGVMAGIFRIDAVFSNKEAAEKHKKYIEEKWADTKVTIEDHEVWDE